MREIIFIGFILILKFSMILCGGFTVDMSEVRLNEMANNVDDMKVAIMGMAEYIEEINKNLKDVQLEVNQLHRRPSSRPLKTHRGLTVDEILKREELAKKLENLFKNDNLTKVEVVKQEIGLVVETNFIKMLSAILLTEPIKVEEQTPQILKLMRSALNGELDFKSIVDRLPFLIRSSETNQFILLLKALRDNKQPNNGRQFGGLQDLGKVIDAAGKLDLKQVSEFMKEIPQLFESIESVVDGVDEYF